MHGQQNIKKSPKSVLKAMSITINFFERAESPVGFVVLFYGIVLKGL